MERSRLHVGLGDIGKNAGDKITGATFLEVKWRGEVGQDAVGILDWAERSRVELTLFYLFGS